MPTPRLLRWVYAGWFALIMVALAVQLYLAGLGVFSYSGPLPFKPHVYLGFGIGIAFLVGIGLAFATKVSWRMIAANFGLVLLMFLQSFLAHTEFPALSALHVVNGVLIVGLSGAFTGALFRLARSPLPAAQPSPPASGS